MELKNRRSCCRALRPRPGTSTCRPLLLWASFSVCVVAAFAFGAPVWENQEVCGVAYSLGKARFPTSGMVEMESWKACS